MVAVTGAAVSGESTRDRFQLGLWHLAGLLLGAGVLGLLMSATGEVAGLPDRPILVALGALMVGCGVAALGGRPVPVPSSRAQVPRAWRYTMTPAQYAFAYGVGLGLGLTTRVLSVSLYALVLLIAVAGDVRVGVPLAIAYAITRALPVFLALARPDAPRLIDGGDRWRARALALDGAVVAGAGMTLVAFGL